MRKFILVGRTGVGKSSFINATFGKYVAQTSKFEACTKIVEHYADNTPLGNLCLIDTPGLAEDDEALDKKYLNLVRSKVDLNQIDAIIYVTRLDETRFRLDEKRTLRLLTNQFGASIWNRSWLVLTFAASVPAEQRKEVTRKRVEHIEAFLKTATTQQQLTKPFPGFKVKLRVDNVMNNWASNAFSVVSVLNHYQ